MLRVHRAWFYSLDVKNSMLALRPRKGKAYTRIPRVAVAAKPQQHLAVERAGFLSSCPSHTCREMSAVTARIVANENEGIREHSNPAGDYAAADWT